MPPRRGNAAAGARATQEAQGADEAGPSNRIPEFVTFALIQAIMADGYKKEQEVKVSFVVRQEPRQEQRGSTRGGGLSAGR